MKVKCYSVRLQSLVSITDRAFKATSFDGSQEILPKSQVFGIDFSVTKSDAYWIAAWILEKKNLQYSCKKEAWFNPDTGRIEPTITVTMHVPKKKEAEKVEPSKELKR